MTDLTKKLNAVERAQLAASGMETASSKTPALLDRSKPESHPPRKSSTGPGTLMTFMGVESQVMIEAQGLRLETETLRKDLKALEGSLPARQINATLVQRSIRSNRLSESFESESFIIFRETIEKTGGNLVPGKVRPIFNADTAGPQRYEVVWGQRRHQACLDLGLPFLALVETLTDKAAFREADHENRCREDLRPYEQGMSYRDALDSGLYPSIRMLAEDVEVSITSASVAVKLARLPNHILQAFPSRLDLQFRWASPLSDAAEHHADELEARIQAIEFQAENGLAFNSAQVFEALTKPFNKSTKGKTLPEGIEIAGKKIGSIRFSGGRLVLEISKGVIPSNKASEISEKISQEVAKILSGEKLA